MTEDLRMKIKASHAEEIADYDKYIAMSKLAETNGEYRISGLLEDIACDEKSHKEILEHILDKWGGVHNDISIAQ